MAYLDSSIPSLPFISGSATSRDAAITIQHVRVTQFDRYVAWMRLRGDQGATDKETCLSLGIQRSSICCRRNEAMALGLIEKTERRRGACAVYVAKEK